MFEGTDSLFTYNTVLIHVASFAKTVTFQSFILLECALDDIIWNVLRSDLRNRDTPVRRVVIKI